MTQHNFCSQCGNPLNAADRFCPQCGADINNMGNSGQKEENAGDFGVTGAFPRMLAYIPGLFWVPLAADSKDKSNRECANQGLLLLLYCIIVPFVFSIVGAILINLRAGSATDTSVYPVVPYPYQYQYQYPNSYPYSYPLPQTEFDSFGSYFSRFGDFFNKFGTLFNSFGTAYASPYSKGAGLSNSILGMLIGVLHMLFILYIPINSIWGFIHCISHREPHILPVIGKLKVIK